MKRYAALLIAVMMCFACMAYAESPSYTWKVSAPNGAPALALAVLAADHPDQYTFVAADTISAEFAAAEADFIIAPVNAGAKLFKAGKSTYRLGAVVTWGNLYFASQKESFSSEDLAGAAITLFGENTINAAVALYALAQNGIEPGEITYLAGAANTQALLLSDENAVVLTAEPALTAAKMKNDRIGGFSLNELYRKATGYDGFAQAGLFIREATITGHPEAVDEFLTQLEASCLKCSEDAEAVAEAAVKLEILPNAKVAMNAIPHCAIRYLAASEAREQVETVAGIDLTQFGGELPADGFYYGAE